MNPLTQIRVLLDQAGQLVLHQVEEGINFVLVVSTLTDGWLTERDVVYISWCKRHCLPLSSLDVWNRIAV
ncbi:Uncharacterised protein [Mycobacteroides abscessus subsp. abscessus]|nr:Uncharacterised protein [Mycobacteroides abscessus subsp. abscessus]